MKTLTEALLRKKPRGFGDDGSSRVVGPVKPCTRCGTPTRDADVEELSSIVKVLERALPIITEDGKVVVGFRVHDQVECERAAIMPHRRNGDGERPRLNG